MVSGGKMKIKLLTTLCIATAAFFIACGKSDPDLAKAVADKFAAENITNITVTVSGGVATLSGEVQDITIKNRAEAAAKGVEGIKSVTNNVTVKAPPPALPPVDPALKGKVEENLRKAGCTGITIEVGEGKVIAKGKVADAKYAECVRVIQESGATGFDNQIEKAS
jgi:hyperosmotically inducible periplasmic protein